MAQEPYIGHDTTPPDFVTMKPCDVWRTRITKLDAYQDFEFEWHDDILYRSHEGADVPIKDIWQVEIVSVSTGELKRVVRSFDTRDEAEALAAQITDQSHALSVADFMDVYLVDW